MPYQEPQLTQEERKLTDFSKLPATDPQKIAEAARLGVGRATLPADKAMPSPAKRIEWAGTLEREGCARRLPTRRSYKFAIT